MHPIRRSRLAAAGILALIAALAAYWYFSPYLAMRRIQAAADAGDFETVNEHVDYPRLRENIKAQLHAAIAENMKGKEGNPFATFGADLATVVVSGMVEALVRPVVVIYILRTGRTEPPARPASPSASPAPPASAPKADSNADPKDEPRWRLQRQGPNRVVFHRRDAGEDGVGLVFDRYGFASWKLSGMQLPASALPRPASGSRPAPEPKEGAAGPAR